MTSNVLYVDQGHDSPCLQSTRLRASQPTFTADRAPAKAFRCTAKTRYRQSDEACQVTLFDDATLEVHFDRPQRAVTPGQSVVFYDGEECLGGAVIDSTNAPDPSKS